MPLPLLPFRFLADPGVARDPGALNPSWRNDDDGDDGDDMYGANGGVDCDGDDDDDDGPP